MDNKSDSVWIEPLEATALSDDEETRTQAPIYVKGDMRLSKKDKILISCSSAERGRTDNGGGGVSYDSPPYFQRLE